MHYHIFVTFDNGLVIRTEILSLLLVCLFLLLAYTYIVIKFARCSSELLLLGSFLHLSAGTSPFLDPPDEHFKQYTQSS